MVDPHDDPHALHPVVQAEVSSIRTDLDRFSDLEANALVAHGYEVARSLNRRLGDNALKPVAEGPPWEPLPGRSSVVQRGSQAGGAEHAAGTARTAATNESARIAVLLRRSSQRKVWSTLLDWKDWPTYLYIALAALLFVYLPVRFYKVHRRAEMLTSVIDSIAKGDPDIRIVLDLVESDPFATWRKIEVTEAPSPTPDDFAGLEILSYSRINDLRNAWSGRLGPDSGGRVHFRDRVVLRVTDAARRGRGVVFRNALDIEDVDYRQPKSPYPIAVQRVAAVQPDASATRYEYHCDLSKAPLDEPITLELGGAVRFSSLPPGRMPMVMQFDADLVNVWLLFPEDHSYRRYDLVRYPRGAPDAAEPLTSRYTIDHPYGQLIGWSVIMPRRDTVYESRWTSD